MLPLLPLLTESAESLPLLRILAARTVILPPLAKISPKLIASFFRCSNAVKSNGWVYYIADGNFCPASKEMLPPFTLITPSFFTLPPIRFTLPSLPTVIKP